MNVLLVSMPFGAIDRPALGISTLKARLQECDIACDIVYPSLAFADRLGPEPYQALVDDVPYMSLACEWVFAASLFGSSIPPADAYVAEELVYRWRLDRSLVDDVILPARGLAADFLDETFASIAWSDYDVVGFSTVAQQNIASLALAQRLKGTRYRPVIVFGGHAWEGPMGRELLARFPFVDFAFSGYADTSLPVFVERLRAGLELIDSSVPGLIYRAGGAIEAIPEDRTESALPEGELPDFSEYFSTRAGHPRLANGRLLIPIESSRGCWWASRVPCRFCGLGDGKRAYRSKSPTATLGEIRSRAAEWPGSRLDVIDNVVPDTFLDEVLPVLAAHRLGATLSFAVRPEVRREHVRDAAAAGSALQCGVESLSDRVLRLMGKGTSSLRNIRLLKWCLEYGVDLSWNMLYAIPGETAEDYRQVTALMPAVHFLSPPDACAPVVLERFSCYFERPSEFGLRHTRPVPAYYYVYPFDERSLAEVAYFFDYAHPSEADRPAYVHRLRSQVMGWKLAYGAGRLHLVDGGDELLLSDSRYSGSVVRSCLKGLDRRLYLACEDIGEFSLLCGLVGCNPDLPEDANAVRRRLDGLVANGWMVSNGEQYLSLAVRECEARPRTPMHADVAGQAPTSVSGAPRTEKSSVVPPAAGGSAGMR